MEIRQLKTFATIAKFGSFTKAADVLGYAQSTLTTQIQSLEAELGVVLFERFARQIKLTQAGENLLSYAEQIIRLTEAAQTLAENPPLKGTIVVGAPESFALHCLYDVVKEYRLQYPEVEIDLHFGTCCDFHNMLGKNLLDFAFLLDNPLQEEHLVSHDLFGESVVFIASPQHPLAQKGAVLPEDLSAQNLIVTEVGCIYRDRLDDLIRRDQLRPASTMEVSSVEFIKRLARDGLGLSLLAKTTVDKELDSGDLITLPWQGPSFDARMQLVHHRDKHLSPPLQLFRDLTLKVLRR